MQAFGFDEADPGKATPLPLPAGPTPSAGKEALVSREGSPRASHRPPPAAVSAAPNVMALVNALRRRWQLALTLGLLLGVITAVSAWFFRPVSFNAMTLLNVKSVQPHILFVSEGGRADFVSYQRTQLALIKTRPVLNAALREPSVNSLAIIRDQLNPIEWLEKKIQADFPAPEIMRIVMSGQNEKDLIPIVEAVRDAYLNEIVNKENLYQVRRLNKLKEMWADSDENLKGKRNTLRTMAKGLGGVGEKGLAARQQFKEEYLKMLQGELLNTERDLNKSKLALEMILSKQKTAGNVAIPPETLDALAKKDAGVERTEKEIASLQQYLTSFKERSPDPDNAPDYKAKVATLAVKKQSLEDRIKTIRPELAKQYQLMVRDNMSEARRMAQDRVDFFAKAETDWKARFDKAAVDAQKFGEQAVDLKWLEDDIAQVDALSKEIASQRTKLEVEINAPPRVTKLQDAIALPTTTEGGRIGFACMVGLGTLFAVIFGIAFLESKARRVSHVEDVTQGLKIHLMGSIPNVPKRALAGSTAARDVYWQNRLTESVDAIRTTLMNAARFEGLRVVMVTSAVGGEGKTLLACHLAASLARAGLKTLLIDGDLRRPSVHRLFGLPLPRGLAELLQGEIEPADATHTGLMDGLAVISAGQRDGRSAQALAGQRIREVLDQLRGSYDFIVVDSAPVLPVADSQLIGQHTDGVVFSIMRDVSRLPQVYAAYERLAVLRIRTLGAVVNGISGGTYGAGDYYYIASAPAETTSAAP